MKPVVIYQDFDKLDLRIGTIIEATVPDWSTKLLRFVVDFGEELGTRVIFSGIRKWYVPEECIGKQYVFLVNLAPKKMGDEESNGMMIMADTEDQPILMPLQSPVANGTMVR